MRQCLAEGEPLDSRVRMFLTSRPRIAQLATSRKNGHPWLQPLWFLLDRDEIIVIVTEQSVTGKSLRRTRRAALCVDEEELPYAFAVLEGAVALETETRRIVPHLSRMVARYQPDSDIPREVNAYLELDLLMARLKIERVYFVPQVIAA